MTHEDGFSRRAFLGGIAAVCGASPAGVSPPRWRFGIMPHMKLSSVVLVPLAAVVASVAAFADVPFPGITSDTVELEDGVYRLDAPITIGADRSGTPEKPIVLRAKNRGKVVLSGMVSISDWQKTDLCGGNVWVGTIPGAGEIPGWRSAGCVY